MSGARNRLDNKVAIVTGAGMGMGAATARVFAGYGAKVVVSDINQAAGEETVATILAAGGEASFIACDVAEEDQVIALVAATVAKYGRLDCAVNNAAITPDVLPVAEADMAVCHRGAGDILAAEQHYGIESQLPWLTILDGLPRDPTPDDHRYAEMRIHQPAIR